MPLGTKAGTVGTKVGKWCKLGSYNEIYLSFQLEHFDSLSPCHWRPAGVNSFNTDLVIKGRFCALCPVASMAICTVIVLKKQKRWVMKEKDQRIVAN